MKRIAIAIHGGENVDFGAYANHLSMIALASQDSETEIVLVTTRGARIAQARNVIIKKVQELGSDYVLFLDTDHIVPKNMISLLLQNMDKASCISGLVCRRRDTFDIVGFNIRDNEYHKIKLVPNTGVYFVDVCAFGCTLIDTSVFEEMKGFSFSDETKTSSKGPFLMRSDILFCETLRNLGKKLMIDTRVVVGHIGEPVVVWPWNGKKLKELTKQKVLSFQHS